MIRCFTIFRIHKYSVHFWIIHLLSSLYCYIPFSDFFLLDTKNILFFWFHLVNFQVSLCKNCCILWSVCLGVYISNRVAKSEGCPFPFVSFIRNISHLKALGINSRPLLRSFTLSKVFLFFLSLAYFGFSLDFSLKLSQFLVNCSDLFQLHLY